MKHAAARLSLVCAGIAAMAVGSPAWAASGNVVLIRRDRPVQTVKIEEITTRRILYRDGSGEQGRVALETCVAFFDPDAVAVPRQQGWLRLADGQRFPGEALSGARAGVDVLAWNPSSWLGRLEVPLERVESVVFVPGGELPDPGGADMLLLTNGDRLEGIITALGDPVALELARDGETIELPLGRVVSVRMATPPRKPGGRRLWLVDGTVVDASEVTVGDDGRIALHDVPFATEDQPRRIELSSVMGVLFHPQGFVPLAAMRPDQVEGPPTRYVVPHPRLLDETAALGLARVEFIGPLSVRYSLPHGASWLSAEAELPLEARAYGNFDLVIRDDQREIFSGRLSAENPRSTINAPLRGSALTVEITEGSSGPVQDHVVLLNAFVLVN